MWIFSSAWIEVYPKLSFSAFFGILDKNLDETDL